MPNTAPSTLTPPRFFLVWLLIGVQSFGGGTASFALIQRTSVDRYQWLSEADFVRDWALVQLAPGINLLGLIVLIGRRWGGSVGVLLALGGLLLPSACVTILMAALYAQIANQPAVKAALSGVLPATVGLGLISAYGMLRPLVKQGNTEGRSALVLTVGLVAACALIAGLWSHLPVVFILFGGGAIFAVFRAMTVHPTTPEARTDVESAVPETVSDALTNEEAVQ